MCYNLFTLIKDILKLVNVYSLQRLYNAKIDDATGRKL